MGQEIRRIRINKLSSENNIFNEIIFHDGINLILGEKYDIATTQGRKTNGVGKSMCIEFLDFCLLCDYGKSRIKRIPVDILPISENIILDLTIGIDRIIIKRNRKNHETTIFIRNGKQIQFDKLQDARNYLQELIFDDISGKEVPSFRSLLSLLVRDERSEFTDILRCHDASKRVPEDLTAHLYVLGVSLKKYHQVQKTIKEIDEVGNELKRTKRELTGNRSKKISDVKAELNMLNSELQQIEEAIETFKTNDAYNVMQYELIDIENKLESLRTRQTVLKHEYEKIMSLPAPEHIDDSEIELVYNHFKKNLGTAVVKSLNEVVAFKNEVEKFQRVLLNQKAKELEIQIAEISEQLRFLDDQYAEKLRIIDKKGTLKNLKTSISIYESKKEECAHTRFLFGQYEKAEKEKKLLDIRKAQEIISIDNDLDNMSDELSSFTTTILDIHESIMGNRECSFDITTNSKPNSKNPIDIDLRIYDDGSHSVNRTKVFIYDMALMFNEYTQRRHPLFLIHDNIFDVDQDTLVQCLNYVYRQEEYNSNFQYILTLNRDKIENEERINLIKMDIDDHKTAVFTKENKFLKKSYKEE